MKRLAEQNKNREIQEQQIITCLQELTKPGVNEKELLLAGLEILHKLTSNVVNNPNEEKYK